MFESTRRQIEILEAISHTLDIMLSAIEGIEDRVATLEATVTDGKDASGQPIPRQLRVQTGHPATRMDPLTGFPTNT